METSYYKYKICLHKSYFDTGLSLTNYLKYLIAFFGLATLNLRLTMIIAVVYAVVCYLLGYLWFKYAWINAEREVKNKYDEFVKEMRGKYR